MPPRAVVISDSPVLRAGLVALAGAPLLEVGAQVADPARLCVAVQATRAQVVLAAPVNGSVEPTCAALLELPAGCGALVLLAGSCYRIQASTLSRRYGCWCLPLHAGARVLDGALRTLLRADVPVRPSLVMDDRLGGPGGMLTSREHDVLRELARGSSNRAIAERLLLSNDTVKSHLRSIYRKLQVQSRGQAISLYVGEVGAPAALGA